MEPSAPSNKRVWIIGGILLVVLLAFVSAFLSNRQDKGVEPQSQPESGQSVPANVEDILAFQPPANAKYSSVADINFIPATVNTVVINREKILQQAKSSYPNATQQELLSTVNQAIFYWLAMNDLYNTNDKAKVSRSYLSGTIDNFSGIDNEFHQMAREYTEDEIKLDGFFIRVRFAGVRPENIQKLGKKETELRALAQHYVEDAKRESEKFPQKDRIVDYLNQSKTIELLNNGEKSQKFTNRSLFPPLVGDPNYYTWVQRLLVGQYSDTITLKRFNAQQSTNEDYAFAFFYISKKAGNHLPLNILADQFVSKSQIN